MKKIEILVKAKVNTRTSIRIINVDDEFIAETNDYRFYTVKEKSGFEIGKFNKYEMDRLFKSVRKNGKVLMRISERDWEEDFSKAWWDDILEGRLLFPTHNKEYKERLEKAVLGLKDKLEKRYDHYTEYIDDGGQRQSAERTNGKIIKAIKELERHHENWIYLTDNVE